VLFSIPSKLGIGKALWVGRLSHLISSAALVGLGFSSPRFGVLYFIAVAVALALLATEHALVSEKSLQRVGMAFFLMNAMLSLTIGTLGIIDIFI
jgi:4-hydroxybenzoate polyprenyltransferase